jgi:hypothetical protein
MQPSIQPAPAASSDEQPVSVPGQHPPLPQPPQPLQPTQVAPAPPLPQFLQNHERALVNDIDNGRVREQHPQAMAKYHGMTFCPGIEKHPVLRFIPPQDPIDLMGNLHTDTPDGKILFNEKYHCIHCRQAVARHPPVPNQTTGQRIASCPFPCGACGTKHAQRVSHHTEYMKKIERAFANSKPDLPSGIRIGKETHHPLQMALPI